jgi:putative redox protein
MSILKTKTRLINDRIKFEGTAGANPPIITDYLPPVGNLEGYLPLEIFLISLSTCLGGSITSLVRKMGFTIDGFSIEAAGNRRETHPTYFDSIDLAIVLQSPDAAMTDLQKALEMSESKYCPFTAMLNDKVKIHYDLKLNP